jgi:hypothetical protein
LQAGLGAQSCQVLSLPGSPALWAASFTFTGLDFARLTGGVNESADGAFFNSKRCGF